ncbi:MAG: nascent polypeptide-associated complex protein [Candidatus Aenigmatarchaeota archaeon]
MRINPRQIEKMMKQMGMQSQEIPAEEVIIRGPDKTLVITNPQVTRVNAMGQDTFQIVGNVHEEAAEKFTTDDVRMVMDQTGANEKEAKAALEETGDLAGAIVKLKTRS